MRHREWYYREAGTEEKREWKTERETWNRNIKRYREREREIC